MIRKGPENIVYLGLGSNLGDSLDTIKKAIKVLNGYLKSLRTSSLYLSEPLYITDQPRFVNTVVEAVFDDEPIALLDCTLCVEKQFGRNRTRPKGERTLDIDILLFGNRVVDMSPRLNIPHPLMRERRFVLEPLIELAPALIDPVTGLPFSEFLSTLGNQGLYYLEPPTYNQALHLNGVS